MCRNWRIPCSRTWSAWRWVSSQLSGEPWDSSPMATPSPRPLDRRRPLRAPGARRGPDTQLPAEDGGGSAPRGRPRAAAGGGRVRSAPAPRREILAARGTDPGVGCTARTEAADRGAGWAALCPTAWPLARFGSRPAPAPRRRRRPPQPRRGGGSRFSLPVSCTSSFLLVTKTCAAEHAQCSQPLATPQRDPPLRIL